MDIDSLRQFLILAETLNFTQAAEKAFVSQPTLSRHISALEKELGDNLFIRDKKRVILSETGKTIAEHARVIIEEYEKIHSKNGLKNVGVKKRLRVHYSSYPFMLELCTEANVGFQKKYPNIDVEFTYGAFGDGLPAILDGAVDGAFILDCGLEKYPKIKKEIISPSGTYVLVNRKNPIANNKKIYLKEIADMPIILPKREAYPELFDFCMRQLSCCGTDITARLSYVASSKEAMAMVAENKGVTILNKDGNNRDSVISTIAAIPVYEAEFLVNIVFAWRERQDRGIAEFAGFLKKAVQGSERYLFK